ncbi:unnamed protein product [Coffea canephora]|uniref:Uncharacterized protein n=1 Tax=Coffea canephora TaxID=49390 RepID=A0A068UJD6_COFCA|nr:unnamed protein product [Coffea canephora]
MVGIFFGCKQLEMSFSLQHLNESKQLVVESSGMYMLEELSG